MCIYNCCHTLKNCPELIEIDRKIFLILICISTLSYGQIENKWQPDSIYSNRKVKKIYVYLNSQKDLSEIVEFNRKGKRKRIEKYSASYNKRTRKSKTTSLRRNYKYNYQGRLEQIIDSTMYLNNSILIFKTNYEYDANGLLLLSEYYRLFEKPYSVTKYSYEPFKSTTIRQNDSILVYEKTKEYDKDFYVKRFYGFYLEPKLKKVQSTNNGETNTVAYSDQNDFERYDDNKTIKNSFDEKGRLIKSEIKSIFMNDRTNEYELNYKYYKNGLLKSVRGYVPRYFKYEFWE